VTISRWSALAIVLLAASQACVSPTENCAAPRRITGVWQYSATQDAPASASLTGTLLISTQTCHDFEGVLDFVELSANGQSRRVAGPVSGVLVDSAMARFDATLGGDGASDRQHLARFGADSVTGTWVEVGAASVLTGRFAARLQEPR
jgi:hypothetical protein